MYYKQHPLRFACTGCGKCCTGNNDHFVAVTHHEQKLIQRFLKISWRWFRRRYIERYEDGQEGLRLGDNGRCSFLGQDNRCRIYAVRPSQCSTYPYWPELVRSRSAWQREAHRCEGIGRGPVVSRSHIDRQLKLQNQS